MICRCSVSQMLLQWRKHRPVSQQHVHFFSTSSSKPGGRRPKKKIYHREPDLDRAMDLHKLPTLLLRLRSIILSSKTRTFLLRDLEKEVGFVQKWAFQSLIEKHPTIFRVHGGGRSKSPISVGLTETADRVSDTEEIAREEMEVLLVRNLRKLLMMSMDCQVPMEKIRLIAENLGLPENFESGFIQNYPQFFKVRNLNARDYLCLENWDSNLVVTAREESLQLSGASTVNKKTEISRDGNYSGPHAFKLKFPAGFRPNTHYLREIQKWQKLSFPSPYLNARQIQTGTPQARKRAVAVLHELLSLTMMKRLSSDKLDAFHNEYQLPCRLLLCLVKNHGMFYITNKGSKSTVFLKEGYNGCYVANKCSLLRFYDRFAALSGRNCPLQSNPIQISSNFNIQSQFDIRMSRFS